MSTQFSPSDPTIKANLPRIREILKSPSVHIFFVPSSHLVDLIAKGEHPLLQGMPDVRKAELLSGHGIMIQNLMVWRWLNGELGEKQCFILSNGEIRVADENLSLIDKGKATIK